MTSPAPPAIQIQHLHYRYPDGTMGIEDVCLEVGVGERWGLVGANGCGNSTLLHHVAGLFACGDHLRIEGCAAEASRLAAEDESDARRGCFYSALAQVYP